MASLQTANANDLFPQPSVKIMGTLKKLAHNQFQFSLEILGLQLLVLQSVQILLQIH